MSVKEIIERTTTADQAVPKDIESEYHPFDITTEEAIDEYLNRESIDCSTQFINTFVEDKDGSLFEYDAVVSKLCKNNLKSRVRKNSIVNFTREISNTTSKNKQNLINTDNDKGLVELLTKLSTDPTTARELPTDTELNHSDDTGGQLTYISREVFIESVRKQSFSSQESGNFKLKKLPLKLGVKSFKFLRKLGQPVIRKRLDSKSSYEEHLVNQIYGKESSILPESRQHVYLSLNKSYPVSSFSIIRYRKAHKGNIGTRQLSRIKSALIHKDKHNLHKIGTVKNTNFKKYFLPENEANLDDSLKFAVSVDNAYNPNLLDCTDLQLGIHRVVKNLPGYSFSIIGYKEKKALKEEINTIFRDRFPKIPATFTLSKLRSLKKKLIRVSLQNGVQLTTIAFAFVYFEKLVFRLLVDKYNRKLLASVCLMLAYKFNEFRTELIPKIQESLATIFKLNQKDIVRNEFRVFSLLRFNLLTPKRQWKPHLKFLLQRVDSLFFLGCEEMSSSSSSNLSDESLEEDDEEL